MAEQLLGLLVFPLKQRIENRLEMIADTVGTHPAEDNEASICGDNIALTKAAVVHCYIRGDTFSLGRGRRLSLDPAMFLSKGSNCRTLKKCTERERP